METTHTAENVAPITEDTCRRVRRYVDQHEGMCWCGFDSEDWNDQAATLDHVVHSLVDDWPGFITEATRVIPPVKG